MIEEVNPKKKSLWDKIRYKYWEIWPYDLRPGVMLYNFKCWSWKRYSTIKPRTLGHTWCDRRELLLHMSFEILVQFIERECSPGHTEWYGEFAPQIEVNGVEINAMDEMLELKQWWEVVYQKDYPEKTDEIWEAAEKVSPRHVLTHEDDMPDCVAGTLEFVYEDDEQRDTYRALMGETNALECHMDAEAEKMLKRLAAVRLWMWT